MKWSELAWLAAIGTGLYIAKVQYSQLKAKIREAEQYTIPIPSNHRSATAAHRGNTADDERQARISRIHEEFLDDGSATRKIPASLLRSIPPDPASDQDIRNAIQNYYDRLAESVSSAL